MPALQSFPVPYFTFKSYLAILVNFGFPEPLDEIQEFADRCNRLVGCEYAAETYACRPRSNVGDVHTGFQTCVRIIFGLIVAKESAKLLGTLWFMATAKGAVPAAWSKTCGMSVIGPLLCLFGVGRFKTDIVLSERTAWDHVTNLFLEGVLESFPQLGLALYFIVSVSQTGLDSAGILSMAVTFLSCLKLMGCAVWACWTLRKSLKDDLAQTAARADVAMERI
jgi:hypothetical protein